MVVFFSPTSRKEPKGIRVPTEGRIIESAQAGDVGGECFSVAQTCRGRASGIGAFRPNMWADERGQSPDSASWVLHAPIFFSADANADRFRDFV